MRELYPVTEPVEDALSAGLLNFDGALHAPLVFMNADDMRDRGLAELDLVDITSHARDGSTRTVHGYHAVAYGIPRGSAAWACRSLSVGSAPCWQAASPPPSPAWPRCA